MVASPVAFFDTIGPVIAFLASFAMLAPLLVHLAVERWYSVGRVLGDLCCCFFIKSTGLREPDGLSESWQVQVDLFSAFRIRSIFSDVAGALTSTRGSIKGLSESWQVQVDLFSAFRIRSLFSDVDGALTSTRGSIKGQRGRLQFNVIVEELSYRVKTT